MKKKILFILFILTIISLFCDKDDIEFKNNENILKKTQVTDETVEEIRISRNQRNWVYACSIEGNEEEWEDGDWDEGVYPSDYNGPGELEYYTWGAVGLDIWNTWGNGMWICENIDTNTIQVDIEFRCLSNEGDAGDNFIIYLRDFSTWEWEEFYIWYDQEDMIGTLSLTDNYIDTYVSEDGRCDFIVGSNDGYVFDYVDFWYWDQEQPPVADFDGEPTSGNAPLNVSFDDESTGSITSYSWNFGDGGTSSQQNPNHTYQNSGSYTVSLTVTGPGGSDTETKYNYINVSQPQQAYLEPNYTNLIYNRNYETINNRELINFEYYNNEMSFIFNFEEPTIIEDNNHITLTINSCENSEIPGKPILPEIVLPVLIPSMNEINDVILDIYSQEEKTLPKPIKIEEYPDFTVNDQKENKKTIMYSEESLYPEKWCNYFVQKKHGYNILFIKISPVKTKYNENYIKFITSCKVHINLKEGNKKEEIRDVANDKKEVLDIVLNDSLIETYNIHQYQTREEYEYIIVTSQNYSNYFNELKDHKEDKGMTSEIITTEYIYNNYGGEDNQEKIKNYLIYAYNNYSTRYVLLGGDIEIIPTRLAYSQVQSNNGPINDNIPTDLYYGCLDNNWDNDNDGIFGEVEDNPDLLAELYIGRAPVSNLTQVQNFINKVKDKEQSYDNLNTHNYLLVGRQFDSNTWGGDQLDNISNIFLQNPYDVVTMYERDGTYNENVLINRINLGLDYILLDSGHGDQNQVMGLTSSDINSLNNNDYFFIYSTGCNTTRFDEQDCIMENIINNENGGAYTLIGNSRYGWYSPGSSWGSSTHLQYKFFQKLMWNDSRKISVALQNSKEVYIFETLFYTSKRWLYYALNVLGDPEVEIVTEGGIKELIITNTGTAICVLNNIESTLDNVQIIPQEDEYETLQIGESKSFIVSAIGNGNSNNQNGTITFNSNAINENLNINVEIVYDPIGGTGSTGEIPIVNILSINPNPANPNEQVFLQGAVNSTNEVIEYLWQASITNYEPGPYYEPVNLGNTLNCSFNTTILETGTFEILFIARNTNGWSIPSITELVVFGTEIEENNIGYGEKIKNKPNPFESETEIYFNMIKNGNIKIEIFNLKGQKIKTLVNDFKYKGDYRHKWDCKDRYGEKVESGIYFYTIQTNEYRKNKKMLIIK